MSEPHHTEPPYTEPPDDPFTGGPGPGRIDLRVPGILQIRIEAAAARAGVPVNVWLTQVATDALGAYQVESESVPRNGQRYIGWVR